MSTLSLKHKKTRKTGILTKTAFLSWMVTLITMGVFIAAILPEQKKVFQENLQSKAHGVSVSLQDIAAGAVVTEDYSEVVDHCMQVLSGDKTIEFLVLTRNDGFSLIHTKKAWANEQMTEAWHPEQRDTKYGIEQSNIVGKEVYKFSRPFNYSGIQWGWIHIGLSLDSYYYNVSKSYTRTAWLGSFCILMGLLASIIYAKRLVRPILSLQLIAQEVAEGNLNARADVRSADEVQSLAQALNTMTQAVQDREARIRSQNKVLATLVTDKALHAGDIVAAAKHITETSAKTLAVQRASVWLFDDEKKHIECIDQFDARAGDHSVGEKVIRDGNEPYFSALETSRVLMADDALNDHRTMCLADNYLKPLGISSMMDAPIRAAGRLVGVVCNEYIGEPRHWTLEEENFAGSTADLIALSLEARDRKTAQDQLLAAKEAAEAASSAKSQFLANMSHEIRTPINGVMGMLQLLEASELNDRQKHLTETALSSVDSLLSVIGDVLDFSKIEAGHFELDHTAFDLRDTIDKSVRLFAERTQSNGVELSYDVSGDIPDKAIGDPNRLRQVLINLIGNAVKFTEEGEIHLDCQLIERHSNDLKIKFSVRDTGTGISSDQIDHIFDSFAQGDASMQRRHGGTGLGLAISRHIVSLMGGKIDVKSDFGKGSTFTFTIRLDLPEELPDRQTFSNDDFNGLQVLVVDDSENVRRVLCSYIQSWGGKATQASNASDAIAQFERSAAQGKPYHIVLVDKGMPGIGGLQLARLLREGNGLNATALILLSGIDLPNKSELQATGFASAVAKPARASELYNAIITAAKTDMKPIPSAQETKWCLPDPAVAGAKILVVEDNSINQEVVKQMLAQIGHSCDCLDTGAAALDAVSSGQYGLVLMDCQMPGMDGYTATETIREWEREYQPNGRTPIIAVTAHAMKGDRERCLAAGMDDYLSKPIQIQDLKAKLNKWLDNESSDSAADPEESKQNPSLAYDGIELESAIVARCSGNRALAGKLVGQFISQTAEDIDTISKALIKCDPKQMANAAHRLKGAAGNLAIYGAEKAAEELCTLGLAGKTEGANHLVSYLQDEADRVASLSLLKESSDSHA